MCKCKICGNTNYPINTKKFPKDFCSYKCYEEWLKFNREPNCECAVCGKPMYLKPTRIKRAVHGVTCSLKCANLLKSEYSKGEGNHQFGLKGTLNNSFKGEEILKSNHNVVDIYVYVPNHPRANSNGRVVKHRLIVEQNFSLYNSEYFEIIDGQYILKKEYDVHHIDGNHNNNDVNNLQVLTREEHIRIHNIQKSITGVVKREELLGSPEVGHQQPNIGLTTNTGSETNS